MGNLKKKSTFTAKTDVKRKELQIKTGAGEMAWSAECLRSKHKEQCHLSRLQSQGWGEDGVISEARLHLTCELQFQCETLTQKSKVDIEEDTFLPLTSTHSYMCARTHMYIHMSMYIQTKSTVGECWSSKTCRLPVKCMRCAGGWGGMRRGTGELASCQSCDFCWC